MPSLFFAAGCPCDSAALPVGAAELRGLMELTVLGERPAPFGFTVLSVAILLPPSLTGFCFASGIHARIRFHLHRYALTATAPQTSAQTSVLFSGYESVRHD